MILIGENINIMSQTIGPALKGRDPKPIHELAKAETAAGIDYLDINIGPARKAGDELMSWAVKTVQDIALVHVIAGIGRLQPGSAAEAGQGARQAVKVDVDLAPLIPGRTVLRVEFHRPVEGGGRFLIVIQLV